MLREDGEEREKLVLEMMKIKQQKDDLLRYGCVKGDGSQTSQERCGSTQIRNEAEMKEMEDHLNGVEPWKEMRAKLDEGVSAFLKWERENGGQSNAGGMEQFMKTQAGRETR